MTNLVSQSLSDSRVAIVQTRSRGYGQISVAEIQATEAVAALSKELGWFDERRGAFGTVIPEGSRVLVKPNWVMHENQGPGGMDPLVTHASLVRAVVATTLLAKPSEVLVGDAPVQGCDFQMLLDATKLGRWAADLAATEVRFRGIHDFRRTTCTFAGGVRVASENLIAEDCFVLFDLGAESLLEPVTDCKDAFRVTCYDPRMMARTHAPGRHQYLVAKQAIDADVIINLPKLKTHKKAGITCALKNLIGINGNKEYLPHHRTGGSLSGGDCYPGRSIVKRALEYTLDRQNTSSSRVQTRFWREVSTNLDRISTLAGDRLGVEGSWSGNDTVWRTGLDLNRILLYGRLDATLADEPQRRVINVVDAVVAGQGDGPLRPDPLPIGLIFGGSNAAAVDWIGARLLGYDPLRIPITRESFSRFRWPITNFTAQDISVIGDTGRKAGGELPEPIQIDPLINYPAGWRNAALGVADQPT